MSYLKLHEPALFERLARTRHLDGRLVEVADDLEAMARAHELGDFPTSEQVAELKEELRLRIEACEALLDENER